MRGIYADALPSYVLTRASSTEPREQEAPHVRQPRGQRRIDHARRPRPPS